jgi:hypothetical protein
MVNGWDDNLEQNIKSIGENCYNNRVLHEYQSMKFNRVYNAIMYTTIVIGPIAGVISGIGKCDLTLNVIVSSFSFLSGVFASIVKFGKFDEKSNQHRTSSSKYGSLETNIRRQLLLSRKDRARCKEYLFWVSNSFDEIHSAAPILSIEIRENYKNRGKANILVNTDVTRPLTTFQTPTDDSKSSKSVYDEKIMYDNNRMVYEMTRFRDLTNHPDEI